MSLQEQLEKVNEAISAVLITGQEYRHEGRLVRRADLSVLYRERQRLESALEREQVGSGASVAVFEGR